MNIRTTQITSFLRSHTFLLALLALQFVLVNLATGPLFGDAARNLHWGLLTAEDSRFLLGAPDTFERIKGFAPDPPTLSEMHLYGNEQGSLHRWWGPLAPLLFAAIWKLSGSYTLLQLVIPLVGAATVVLQYLLARDILGARGGLLAAAFLACFPIFREYASTSYTEALSALVLTAALLCYRRGKFWATLLLGTLTILTKMDLYPLFVGAVVGSELFVYLQKNAPQNQEQENKRTREQENKRTREPKVAIPIGYPAPMLQCFNALALLRSALCALHSNTPTFILTMLLGPLLLASPWIWIHYLGSGSGGPTRGLSAGLFVILAPQLLELLFYIPWYGALMTLAAIGATVWAGLRAQKLARADVGLLLGWLAIGFMVLLVYAATPGAGNSPRVIIPALPALAILFAAGFGELPAAWRRRIGFYLVVIFLVINLVTIVYDGASGSIVRHYMPAWDVLRGKPQGYVLTERYWETILFTRQKATWFEADKQFETNIMHNRANFAHYISQHPIRYVLLPRDGQLASTEVIAYLDANATRIDTGQMVVWELP